MYSWSILTSECWGERENDIGRSRAVVKCFSILEDPITLLLATAGSLACLSILVYMHMPYIHIPVNWRKWDATEILNCLLLCYTKRKLAIRSERNRWILQIGEDSKIITDQPIFYKRGEDKEQIRKRQSEGKSFESDTRIIAPYNYFLSYITIQNGISMHMNENIP